MGFLQLISRADCGLISSWESRRLAKWQRRLERRKEGCVEYSPHPEVVEIVEWPHNFFIQNRTLLSVKILCSEKSHK